MPMISVIMGVYNCKTPELLTSSIESIRSQTVTDGEFLICDDGSNDGTTPGLLAQLAARDPRIRILQAPCNGGLARALNICLQEARGVYIARQDDDDISLPHRFERELAYLEAHPGCSFVGTNVEVYDETGVWGHLDYPEAPTAKDFLWNSPFVHPTVLFRRDALTAVNGYRPAPETARCEDYDLFMRMYAAGFTGANLQEECYRYRVAIGNKKYRPMPDRIAEAKVRARGFRLLHLYPAGIPYVIKPVLIGLIPQSLFAGIRRRTHQK